MDENNNMNYQQPMQQPVQQAPYQQPFTSVGDWMLTIFLMCIPCVGLILLFVWAFGSNTEKSKSNWAKAQLIWMAIGIVLTIILYAIFGAAILASMGQY